MKTVMYICNYNVILPIKCPILVDEIARLTVQNTYLKENEIYILHLRFKRLITSHNPFFKKEYRNAVLYK